MERINGFDVYNFPAGSENLKYSTEFARKLAQLFQGFYDIGAYQDDIYGGNFMWDTDNRRVMAVDFDKVIPEKHPLADYIRDYSILLTEIYLGDDPIELTGEGKVSFPGHDQLQEELRIKGNSWVDFEIFQKYAKQAIPHYMKERGVLEKIDQRVLDFILRGWIDGSGLTFDEMLNLE